MSAIAPTHTDAAEALTNADRGTPAERAHPTTPSHSWRQRWCVCKCETLQDATRYGVMGGLGLGSLILGACTAVYASPVWIGVTILIVGPSAAVGGLACWNRDHNVAELDSVIVDTQNAAQAVNDDLELARTALATQLAVSAQLRQANEILHGTVTELTKNNSALTEQVTQLGLEKDELKTNLNQLTEQNAELSKQVQVLEEKVNRLESFIGALKESIQTFNDKNAQFKTDIGTLSKEVSSLSLTDDALKKVWDTVDQEADKNNAELAQLVQEGQKQKEELFKNLLAQIADLKSQISTLQPLIDRLTTVDDEIASKSGSLLELEQRSTKAREETEALKAQYKQILASLEAVKTELAQEREKFDALQKRLEEEGSELHQTEIGLSKIADRFDATSKHIDETVATLAGMKQQTDAEAEKINNM